MKRAVAALLVVIIMVAAAGFAGLAQFGRGPRTTTTTISTTGNYGAQMGAVQKASLSGTPDAGAVFKGVTYCDDGSDGGPQQLAIWYPTAGFNGSNPVILWIHGGGWSKGNGPDGGGFPQDYFPGTELLASGFIIASINYRLAPQYPFPAQEYDAQCAVAFLRQNAAALKVNVDEIAVAGASAGAHIASWVGVNETAAYRVSAVGVISPPENVSALYPFDPTWTRAVGDAWGNNSALKYAGSPINFVSASTPPFLIEQGYNDTVVPYQQAVAMYNVLTAKGVPAQLVMVNCAGHVLSTLTGTTCSPDPRGTVTRGDLLSFFLVHP